MARGTNLEVRLHVSTSAPATARRELGALVAHLPDQVRADLQLLVSALVANSVRHGELSQDDWIELRAHLGPETVQVEVSDPGGSFEPAAETPLRSGLWILDRIADRWGVVRNGATRVWFETDLEPSSIDAPTEPSAQEHRGEPRGRPADAPIVAPWEKAARGWPEEAREAARGLYRLHGPPDEIDEDHLTWRRPGAFELTIRRAVLPPDTNPVGLGKKPQ